MILFGSPLFFLQLPLWLREEGRGPRSCLTTQRWVGYAAAARGKDAFERYCFLSRVPLGLSSAFQAAVAWRKSVYFWKLCHGIQLRPSCVGAVSAYLQEHKDWISLACFLHCCCSLLIQSRAVIRVVLLLSHTAGICRQCAELHCPLKRRVQRRFNTGLM